MSAIVPQAFSIYSLGFSSSKENREMTRTVCFIQNTLSSTFGPPSLTMCSSSALHLASASPYGKTRTTAFTGRGTTDRNGVSCVREFKIGTTFLLGEPQTQVHRDHETGQRREQGRPRSPTLRIQMNIHVHRKKETRTALKTFRIMICELKPRSTVTVWTANFKLQAFRVGFVVDSSGIQEDIYFGVLLR